MLEICLICIFLEVINSFTVMSVLLIYTGNRIVAGILVFPKIAELC